VEFRVTHSPGDIVGRLLIQRSLGAEIGGTWPVYVGSEPTDPDNCITLYDTQGSDHGRDMPTGKTRGHAGFQIRIRATTHAIGWTKAEAIQASLEAVYQETVHVDAEEYLVHAVVRIGDVLSLGKDAPNSGRNVFTLNALLVYKQV
jgi:hypothetical protein